MSAPVLPGVLRGIVSIADPTTRAGRYSWTMDFRDDSDPTAGGAIQDYADSFASIIDDFYNVVQTTQTASIASDMHTDVPVGGHQVEVYRLTGPNAESGITSFSIPTTGTQTALPAEVALVMSKRTSQRGRRFRGRAYLGSWSEGPNIEGRPITATVGNVAAAAAFAFTPVTVIDSLIFGVSSSANPALGLDAAFTDMSQIQVDDAWDSQRRRGFR